MMNKSSQVVHSYTRDIPQAQLEKVILDRVLSTQEATLFMTLLSKKVDETYFLDSVTKHVFRIIFDTYSKKWVLPTIEHIETIVPNYIVTTINDSILELVNELITRWEERQTNELLARLQESLSDQDNIRTKQLVVELQALHNIPRTFKRESYFVNDSKSFVDTFEKRILDKENFDWLQTGLKFIDKDLSGIKNTDFIGFLADEKVGKSWILLWLAYQLSKNGKNVLFISPEMDRTEVETRLHIMHTGFNSSHFYQWTLSPEQFTEWREKNLSLISGQTEWNVWDIITIDDIELQDLNVTTIKNHIIRIDKQLRQKYIKEHPHKKEEYLQKRHFIDILIVDGFHLMNWSDLKKWASEWKESQLVSQWLRSLAKNEKIPILIALHTNRDKQKMKEKIIPDGSDAAFTQSLWRDLTCLISLFRTPQLDQDKKLWMSCVLSRRSESRKVWTINFDPGNGIVNSKWNDDVMTEQEFIDSQLQVALGW